VLFAADGAVKVKELKAGLRKEAEGALVVTTERLLFLADGQPDAIALKRIVSVDVADDIRLTLALKNRKTPLIYFALGNAHTLGQAIRTAFAGK
jgi:hypothetical protein